MEEAPQDAGTDGEKPPYLNSQAFDPAPETSWGKVLRLVPPGSRVLDVGCAYGAFSSAMRRLRACHVTGVEVNAEAARVAREHCDEVIEGDVLALRDRLPGGLDVIVAADVLEHLVEPEHALRLLASRLKPGGVLLASIPNVTHLSVVLALAGGGFPRSREGLLDSTHLRFYGEGDVLALFHQAGYAVRIADRVILDPRLTEFKSDLLSLPQAVLDYLERNPNADTYQFIVRAVPREWAQPGDDQDAPRPSAPAPSAVSIREELEKLHSRLSASQRDASALHQALTKAADRLETQRNRRESRVAQKLSAEERERLRVLFVCDRDDAPFRYRCLNAVRQLRAAGVCANFSRVDSPGLLKEVDRYSVVVLFRLGWSQRIDELVAAARKSGATVGFDLDDLIFDPGVEQWMPFLQRASAESLADYRRSMAAMGETLRAADFCLAATAAIARHARDRGKNALLHPNLLADDYVDLARVIAPLRRALLGAPTFAYLSGSNTHDGDLRSIADPLAAVLDRHPEVRFLIVGHATVPTPLRRFTDRVVQVPYQDHRVYPWLMARCRAVLAPIEEVNEFTNAKSALKVFEAGAFGVPAIASPTVEYQEAIEDGLSGLIADRPEDWERALLTFCERGHSFALGAAARRVALRDHAPSAYRFALARKLLAVAGKAVGAAPPAVDLGPRLPTLREGLALVQRAARLALDPTVARQDVALEPRTAPPAAADTASVWVSSAGRQGTALMIGSNSIGHVLADRDRPISAWRCEEVRPIGERPPGCRFESLGPDPKFIDEQPPAFAAPPTALVLEMRARTVGAVGVAQLFWGDRAEFSEGRSIKFALTCDGQVRRYLIELGGAVPAAPGALRFDPLDRAGEFEVTQLAVLSGALPPGLPDARRGLGERFLAGRGIEIGALQNPLPAPAQAQVSYVDRLTVGELRGHYPELEGSPLTEPTIVAPADDLRPLAAGSQKFVICNHVLEHMRDPIGALREWLRVLETGGILYVSIPSRDNPHDRARPITTFEHILEDAGGRGRRGSDVDRAAYFEWTRSVHGGHWAPAQCDEFAEKLISQDYSIHFHVFDRALFERVLAAACAEREAKLVELVEVQLEDYREWISILRKEEARPVARGVDVIVPIFNARELARRCVASILQHATGDVRVVLVDDASSDPGVAEDLRAIASSDARVVVLTNEKNLGFVGTANRGMRHANGRDVLLLNSDTEVFAGFLDRLSDAARFDAATGIVTPFSNSATIYSIPEFGDNPIPEGHTPESMARLVAAVSRKVRPEMPTAVGFCMYVRAEVLEKVGYFDEETFGRGFGEEDDLCQRARKAGFKVRLCDDAFVWHKGRASFGAEGKQLEGRNGELLRRKHPEYGAEIAHFFRSKPLRRLHAEIRFHIPRSREGTRGAALFLLHASPFVPFAGGTEHHVSDLLSALALPRAVLAFPEGDSLIAAEILDGKIEEANHFRFQLARPADRFCIEDGDVSATLRRFVPLFGIRWAHLHHLMFWPLDSGRTLREAGVPYLFTAHDFYSVCPSWNLFDYAMGESCPCPDPARGQAGCVPAHLAQLRTSLGPGVEAGDLRRRHRLATLDLLRGASAVVAPSEAVRQTLLAHLALPENHTRVIEHGYDAEKPRERTPPGPLLRVAVLGEIAYPLKGSRHYLDLMRATRDLPLEWHVHGKVDRFGYDEELRAIGLGARLRLHGAYERQSIVEVLANEGIDLAVMLPACQETFSFTLSEALIAGIPAMVLANRGAISQRVQREGVGLVVGSMEEAARALGEFCEDRSRLLPLAEKARSHRHATTAGNAAQYRALYESLGFGLRLDGELSAESLRELSERAGLFRPETRQPPPTDQLPLGLKLIQRLLPNRLRPIGGRVLKRIAARPVLILNPARAASLVGLKLVQKNGSTAKYESESTDPQLLFDVRRLSPARVHEFRFRLRRPVAGIAHAQLFWASDTEPGFSEERSAVLLLDAGAGEWRDYVLRLDTSDVAARWRCGNVRQLRFDPIDQPGIIELGRMELR